MFYFLKNRHTRPSSSSSSIPSTSMVKHRSPTLESPEPIDVHGQPLKTISELTRSYAHLTYEYLIAYGMLHGSLKKERALVLLSEKTTNEALPSRLNFSDRFTELSSTYAIEFDTDTYHINVITMSPKSFIDLVSLVQLLATYRRLFVDINLCIADDATSKLFDAVKDDTVKLVQLKHYSNNYFKQAVKRNTIGMVTDCKALNKCVRASLLILVLFLLFVVALPRSLF